MNASLLSDWEFCARLPRLKLADPLQQPPVREAVKDCFAYGISLLAEGSQNASQEAAQKFIDGAMSGYAYPSGEPYTLAQDYATWLDGALRVVEEFRTRLQPLAPVTINGQELDCGAYADSGQIVAYRVTTSFDYSPHWPDFLIQGQYEQPLTVRLLRLPSARDGRLPSPLSLGYRHPATGLIRLSRLTGEKVSFGPSWKRVGRWEIDASWEEWRTGIDRDECMGLVYAEKELEPTEDAKDILRDAERIVEEITSGSLDSLARHREGCQSCAYRLVCHPEA